MNLYGRTTDVSALGLDQSTLGKAFTAAAATEGLKVTSNEEALLRGAYFRSDHFPLARAGVPGTSVENGNDYVGKPAGYGKEQKDKYVAERYHQANDELLPWFTYDGAIQQLRVTVRTAVAVASAPSQPEWAAGFEFRKPGWRGVRRPVRRSSGRRALPPPPPPLYFAAVSRPLPQERSWNCRTSTGFRSPGCSRTPGLPSGTAR